MFTPPLELAPNLPQKQVGDPYLKFRLDSQTLAALPMKHAQEVMVIPSSRITLIPNMPHCVLGLLNQRSRIFWVVDLPQLFGMEPLETGLPQYNLATVQVETIPLGLLVQDIQGVIRLSSDSIQSPIGTVAPGLTPYLHGCVLQDSEILLILDAEAIVHSPLLE